MAEEKEDKFVEVTNDDGTVDLLEILTIIPATEEYNKEYIILQDIEENENGEIGYYPYTFKEENSDDGELTPVESEDELEMIEGVVDALSDIEE